MKLWKHQKEAIDKCIEYIDNFEESDKSISLIQLPTGTGKSGIITVLSRCFKLKDIALVITPRRFLRNQLAEDINGKFFSTIDYSGEVYNNVIEVKQSNQINNDILRKNNVLVLTFQMLSFIERNEKDLFGDICKNTNLVMIDEGHYEPAHNWNKLLENIFSPKILFTATPYRNDAKTFQINPKFTFGVSLYECQQNNFLKYEVIEDRDNKLLLSYEEFVNDVIQFYKSNVSVKNKDARVIIQCGNSADIIRIVEIIVEKGFKAIGIHERFTNNENNLMKNVPNPKDEDATFWVHQYKLLEGVDDPRFQLLALHSPSKNARALVQGIGRIIRNPKREKDINAYVLDYHNGYHKELWESYRQFDEMTKTNEELNMFLNGNDIKALIENQPQISYIDGKFRKQFDLNILDAEKDIQIPLKTQVLCKKGNFDFDKYIKYYEEFLSNRGYTVKSQIIDDNCVVNICVNGNNSEFLLNHVFIEPRLDIVVIIQTKNNIFLYSSIKSICLGSETFNYVEKISKKQLTCLFDSNKKTNITDVTLKNTNIGKNVVRNRKLNAISIENTMPAFDDFEQICTIIEGYTIDDASILISGGKVSKRYLGISNGTIIQYTSRYQNLKVYLNWIKEINKIIDSNVSSTSLFNRYVLEASQPVDTTPLSILFDIDEIVDNFEHYQNGAVQLHFDNPLCLVNNNEFECKIDNKIYKFKINFNQSSYILKCRELDKDYISTNSELTLSIMSYMNKKQCFSVIPQSSECIYVNGEFYNPKYKYGKDFNRTKYDLQPCFFTEDKIGSIGYEKGTDLYYKTGVDMDEWDPKSLFGIISNRAKGTIFEDELKNIDIIICDDGSTEAADFILCDTKAKKVILVHAKAKKVKKTQKAFCSASGLHEVCSQAVKNLIFLSQFNNVKPSNFKSWDSNWSGKISSVKGKKDAQGRVKKRIICSYGWDKEKVWDEIQSCLKHPYVEKEVWIVLGNILSKNTFETKLEKDNPDPVVLHTAYILNSTLTSVASTGAKFRIVCRS